MRRLALCQGHRSCRAKNRNRPPRSETDQLVLISLLVRSNALLVRVQPRPGSRAIKTQRVLASPHSRSTLQAVQINTFKYTTTVASCVSSCLQRKVPERLPVGKQPLVGLLPEDPQAPAPLKASQIRPKLLSLLSLDPVDLHTLPQ